MELKKESVSGADRSQWGRKVFFVAVDPVFLPEAYLEAFMAHGYECYSIHNDFSCPLKTKVSILLAQFPDALLFFDTTARVDGVDWNSYLKQLQTDFGRTAVIGVFYDKQRSRAEKDALKAFFANEARLKGGCVGLEAGAAKNFERIERALKKNNAAGRRTSVRAACDSESTVAFAYQAQTYHGSVTDVSISHFACEIEDSARTIPVYEKLHDMSFVINGERFSSDAALILRRSRPESSLCIFMFINKDGLPGLEDKALAKLSPMLYRVVTEKERAALQAAFKNSGR